MQILILGGTGAMGRPLVQMLSQKNTVYVTSRSSHKSTDTVKYLQGDAKDRIFLKNTLSSQHWDAVVDFMVHDEKELREVFPVFLDNTDQYIFISSARVYAESDKPITEETPRLLDVSDDTEYLKTAEYALAKAREENLLLNFNKTNYTIIRPSITYNTYRLQLGVLEKENWLYRALHGRTIVFSEDINDKLTTMTLGDDVARGIASVVGQKEALGEIFHITYNQSLSWSEVLNVYLKVLEQYFGDGRKIPVILTKKSTNLLFNKMIYQLIYCRYFNRTFNNSKIARFCNIQEFTPSQKGLASCLEQFLRKPEFSCINWNIEAINDRVTGEFTPLSEIPSIGGKVHYLLYRYNLEFIRVPLDFGLNALRKIKQTILK